MIAFTITRLSMGVVLVYGMGVVLGLVLVYGGGLVRGLVHRVRHGLGPGPDSRNPMTWFDAIQRHQFPKGA